MVNNTFSSAENTSQSVSDRSKFDVGRVVEVKDHTRNDNNVHRLKVKVGGMEVDEESFIVKPAKNDINIPSVDDYVLITYQKGNRPIILGSVTPVQHSGDVKDYIMGDRRIGHAESEANIFIKENGDVKIESDNPSQSSPDSPPSADVTHSHTTLKESQQDGRDEADYQTNWVEMKEDDQFFSPGEVGGTYGIGESFQGVVASQPGRGPNYTEFVNLNFLPKRIEFSATLHQQEWNGEYYSEQTDAGYQDEAYGSMSGSVSLNPLSIPNYLQTDSPPSNSSTTPPRQEGEPFKNEQYNNPTNICESEAHFGAGTATRSWMGDGRCIRLIHTQDTSLTEKYRVEAEVTEIHQQGFKLRWFVSNENGAKWNNEYMQPIHYTAYR